MRRILVALALAAIGLAPAPAAAQTTYKCLGKTATIVGTEGNDNYPEGPLFGTAEADVMVGLAGNDYLIGWPNGDSLPDKGDFLCGGDGRDTLQPSYGNDVLAGNAGGDQLIGYFGADRLTGGSGEDQVYGGSGHDWSRGGPDNDRIVDTSTGADQLYGDGGNDSIDAANRQAVHKPDFIDGGDGRDTCTVDETDEVVSCEEVFVLQP